MDIHFGVEWLEKVNNFAVMGTGIRGVWLVSPSTLARYVMVLFVQEFNKFYSKFFVNVIQFFLFAYLFGAHITYSEY
jgi:hypothetical protein